MSRDGEVSCDYYYSDDSGFFRPVQGTFFVNAICKTLIKPADEPVFYFGDVDGND